MGVMLYFLPDVRVVDEAEMAKRGLDALRGAALTHIGVSAGPGGKRGLIAAAEVADATRVGYYPDAQRWRPVANEAYWQGFYRDDPPGPADLARSEQIGGHTVTLADGNDWLVPVARSFPAGTRLPRALVLGPDGQLVMEALPRYAEISADAERVFAAFIEQDESLSYQDLWDIAARALAINYRLGPWELSALRLLDTNNVQDVLSALIDMPSILEAMEAKKKPARPPVRALARRIDA